MSLSYVVVKKAHHTLTPPETFALMVSDSHYRAILYMYACYALKNIVTFLFDVCVSVCPDMAYPCVNVQLLNLMRQSVGRKNHFNSLKVVIKFRYQFWL